MAKQAIADVYRAQEGMDDDMFEDSSAMVAVLGSMARRGKEKDRSRDSSRRGSPPSKQDTRPHPPAAWSGLGVIPAVPSPGMANPI
jgi:hypothetical protein